MSNIDKIRQEIERRKKICEGIFERESDTYYQGKAVAYGELLTFIDSLPEETKDAEQAAARYEREHRQSILSSVDIVNAFIEGARWKEGRR
jgi:hypothetical protein